MPKLKSKSDKLTRQEKAEKRAEKAAERLAEREERRAEKAAERAERQAEREECRAEKAAERAERQAEREERRAERAEERAEKQADRLESIIERTVKKAFKKGIDLAAIEEIETQDAARSAREADGTDGLVEETPAYVSLAGLGASLRGSSKFVISIRISADSGTFESDGNSDVQVTGSGTDTVTFTGRIGDLRDLFRDTQMLTYTGAEDVSGEDAVTFTLSAIVWGREFLIDRESFDIEDTPEEPTTLEGTANDDILVDVDGLNAVNGLEGDDTLDGLAGDDTLDGGAGNDDIRGGEGADTLIGGAGEDTLIYEGSSAGIVVDLNGAQTATGGDATGDTISEFENVYGSDFDDILTGNGDDNVLFGYGGVDILDGGAGDDVLRGGEGADSLTGGSGEDWLRYLGSTSGVTVDLNLDAAGFHQVSGGDAEGDTASGFENIYGSDFGDTLTGDAGANVIFGYGGDDIIDGGAGNDRIRGGEGADTLSGGTGSDVLQYAGSSAGVTVDLNAGANGLQQASGGDAEGDIISEFENVYGSSFDDVITGNASRNILYGYGGNDTLDGGLGNDVLRGSDGADTFVFSTELGAGNVDRIVDMTSGQDTIQLTAAEFGGLDLGSLDASAFVANSGGVANSADQRIVLDTDTGNLYFDADGDGADEAVLFATINAGSAIDENDFFVI